MEIICPLTGSKNIEILSTFEVKVLSKIWKEQYNINVEKEFGDYDKIYLCYNPDAKFTFFSPYISGSSEFYSELQEKINWYYLKNKWEYDYVLSKLEKDKKLLEIGCGSGFFLEKVQQKGLSIKGLEYNQSAVDKAKQNGLPVFLDNVITVAQKEKESYDVVCSFQVMEHVENPASLLRASIDLLKPGGELFICVPNGKSFLKRMFNVFDMPPHHLIKWDNQSLKFIENLFPIKLHKITYEPLSYEHIWVFTDTYWDYFATKKRIKILNNDFFKKRIKSHFINFLIKGGRKHFKGHTICAHYIKL